MPEVVELVNGETGVTKEKVSLFFPVSPKILNIIRANWLLTVVLPYPYS